MSGELENLVLQLLRDMRGEMSSMRGDISGIEAKMATKGQIAELRAELKSDMHSLRADVASDLMTLEKRLSEQVTGLRRSVMEYHSSMIGHGVLITELEERVRRLEQHLKLPPHDAQ